MKTESYYEPLTVTITESEQGRMVRTVLEKRLGVSRKLLSRLKLTEEGITLNGKRVYTSERVNAGDLLAIRMERETSDDILPQKMELDIVFEDDHLLVVNKPAGIVVHPTHGHYTGTLANGVVHHWKEKGEQVRFRPVHRLDEHTSGLVAIAKNPYVHQQLSEQHGDGTIEKRYLAFVYGTPQSGEAVADVDSANEPRQPDAEAGTVSGTINGPIDRDPVSPHVRIVTPDGYPSVTHYETVRIFGAGEASQVRLRLETGRTHQIRVHMKHIGCPLIGDPMYGAQPDRLHPQWEAAAGRQALHAELLAFTHPITRERISFKAELPPDLQQLVKLLEQN
ncbi:RluA family pseudouridine synthase [Paenibacillus beijingensis]|uniref:RNA pseudouridylate synthase n=1 Tax=Paenibacillus beijingensis TaxID=1126833 RepID=A0A0D5NEJ0_9BACL|nr:RluA family pseudouridine synthase [Paenibacillus beijingensis]AJY73636.1 pseudouridine synthase [Paenibacillus beijingensis]